MRRFVIAAVMLYGLLAYANAQTLQVERFDRSGLPARVQTNAERELLRRMSAHRRGDVADAIDIQRKLAQYYLAKGDDDRARIAAERANAAADLGANPASTLPYGSAQVPQFGSVPPRARDSVQQRTRGTLPSSGRPMRNPPYGVQRAPAYGNVPMPTYVGVAAPAPDPANPATSASPAPSAAGEPTIPASTIPVYAPDGGSPVPQINGGIQVYQGTPAAVHPDASANPSTAVESPVPIPPASTSPATQAQESAFSGRYYVMQGQMLHTWEFRADGTFIHNWSAGGAGAAASSYEAGTFSMAGGYLTLFVLQRSAGHPTPAARDRRQLARGAPMGTDKDTRRLRIDMRGPGGKDGLVLGGVMMKPKTW